MRPVCKLIFEKHRSDYQWREQRYKGIVLHGVSKRIVKQARKFFEESAGRRMERCDSLDF